VLLPRCVRPDFCLVHADVADAFLVLLKKYTAAFYTADPQKVGGGENSG